MIKSTKKLKDLCSINKINEWPWEYIESLAGDIGVDLFNLLLKDGTVYPKLVTGSLININKILNKEVSKDEVKPLLVEAEKTILIVRDAQKKEQQKKEAI